MHRARNLLPSTFCARLLKLWTLCVGRWPARLRKSSFPVECPLHCLACLLTKHWTVRSAFETLLLLARMPTGILNLCLLGHCTCSRSTRTWIETCLWGLSLWSPIRQDTLGCLTRSCSRQRAPSTSIRTSQSTPYKAEIHRIFHCSSMADQLPVIDDDDDDDELQENGAGPSQHQGNPFSPSSQAQGSPSVYVTVDDLRMMMQQMTATTKAAYRSSERLKRFEGLHLNCTHNEGLPF